MSSKKCFWISAAVGTSISTFLALAIFQEKNLPQLVLSIVGFLTWPGLLVSLLLVNVHGESGRFLVFVMVPANALLYGFLMGKVLQFCKK
jgi:hypothetical protein